MWEEGGSVATRLARGDLQPRDRQATRGVGADIVSHGFVSPAFPISY